MGRSRRSVRVWIGKPPLRVFVRGDQTRIHCFRNRYTRQGEPFAFLVSFYYHIFQKLKIVKKLINEMLFFLLVPCLFILSCIFVCFTVWIVIMKIKILKNNKYLNIKYYVSFRFIEHISITCEEQVMKNNYKGPSVCF